MSLFYTFYGEADVSSEDFRALLAAATGGTIAPDGTIFREGLNVTAFRVGPDEARATAGYFGFEHRVSAVFNLANRATPEVREHNTVLMVEAVLAYFDAYPGRGVLLFNGEEAILQRLDGGIEFGSDWEDWLELPEVAPLVARHSLRRLGQPLL